jgi:hypothetical protein
MAGFCIIWAEHYGEQQEGYLSYLFEVAEITASFNMTALGIL